VSSVAIFAQLPRGASVLDLGCGAGLESPEQTVTVRPGLITRPRASIRSPWAGERKFTLYSMVKTETPGGISSVDPVMIFLL
jgi:hypothetical protein